MNAITDRLFADDVPNYASTTFPDPRPFQKTAHEALREGFRAGHKNQLIMAPTGAGKSYLGHRIAHEALLKGKRAIFVCDRSALIDQTSETADEYGLAAHGIIKADHWRRDESLPYQIASIQTIMKREFWPKVDVVIIDECFPGDTLIDTPNGKVRIDTLNTGNLIYNSCGEAQIISVFSKVVSATVKVRLSNGTSIECTRDHPIFTEMGWRPAGSLERGARLFCREDVQSLWEGDAPVHLEDGCSRRASGVGASVSGAGMLREILREEIEEPNAQRGVARKDDRHVEADRAQANSSRREWKRSDEHSDEDAGCSRDRMARGVCGEDAQEPCAGVSVQLQDRHCQSYLGDCDRTGWRQPSIGEAESAGREEGRLASFAWVEGVEDVEHASGIRVYNLRVKTHPSYFANGALVHNCHTQYKAWTEFVQKTDAACIGLSATPFSPGLGKLFTNLINAATMDDLTRQGILVPMVPLTCVRADMTGAATNSRGEWADRAAEERGLEIVGDVVAEWIKHGQGRKTIVFGSTIRHCEEITRQFIEAGVMAAAYTSNTTPPERDALLAEYKKVDSAIRVLVSVEALAKGFDVRDVGCVVDCRPLRKSLSTAIQMWGRGLRASKETGKEDCILLDHSGNIMRFLEDFEQIYYHGLDALDMGEKLDKAVRDKDDYEPKGCPSCGHKPFARHCVACGFEKQAPALDAAVAGEMKAVMLGKKKLADDRRHLWEQVCTYARAHSAPDKQSGRAYHLFKDITGSAPSPGWRLDSTPNVEITRNVQNKIRSMNIAFVKARKAA